MLALVDDGCSAAMHAALVADGCAATQQPHLADGQGRASHGTLLARHACTSSPMQSGKTCACLRETLALQTQRRENHRNTFLHFALGMQIEHYIAYTQSIHAFR